MSLETDNSYLANELSRAEEQVTEAWRIINVLMMHYMDEGESYPRALNWLNVNAIHAPKGMVKAQEGQPTS